MLKLPVVLLNIALTPLAVLLMPVVLKTSALLLAVLALPVLLLKSVWNPIAVLSVPVVLLTMAGLWTGAAVCADTRQRQRAKISAAIRMEKTKQW